MTKVEIRDDVAKKIQKIADEEFRSLDGQVSYFLNLIVGKIENKEKDIQVKGASSIDDIINGLFSVPSKEEDYDDDEDVSLQKKDMVIKKSSTGDIPGLKEELPLPFPGTGDRNEWERNNSVELKNVQIRAYNANVIKEHNKKNGIEEKEVVHVRRNKRKEP